MLGRRIFIHTLGENLTIKLDREGEIITLKVPRTKIPDSETAGGRLFLIPKGIQTSISEVAPHSPAEQSKIKAGDVFIQLNSKPIFLNEQVVEICTQNKEKNSFCFIVKRKGHGQSFSNSGKRWKDRNRVKTGFYGSH